MAISKEQNLAQSTYCVLLGASCQTEQKTFLVKKSVADVDFVHFLRVS